jgi:hypothetical protein
LYDLSSPIFKVRELRFAVNDTDNFLNFLFKNIARPTEVLRIKFYNHLTGVFISKMIARYKEESENPKLKVILDLTPLSSHDEVIDIYNACCFSHVLLIDKC